MMAPKTKQTLKITVIGSVCGALLVIGAFAGKVRGFADEHIRQIANQCIEKGVGRDVRVIVEYNRQEALADTVKMKRWNKAIDIVDNAGRIK